MYQNLKKGGRFIFQIKSSEPLAKYYASAAIPEKEILGF